MNHIGLFPDSQWSSQVPLPFWQLVWLRQPHHSGSVGVCRPRITLPLSKPRGLLCPLPRHQGQPCSLLRILALYLFPFLYCLVTSCLKKCSKVFCQNIKLYRLVWLDKWRDFFLVISYGHAHTTITLKVHLERKNRVGGNKYNKYKWFWRSLFQQVKTSKECIQAETTKSWFLICSSITCSSITRWTVLGQKCKRTV